jgi:hypothetical protein
VIVSASKDDEEQLPLCDQAETPHMVVPTVHTFHPRSPRPSSMPTGPAAVSPMSAAPTIGAPPGSPAIIFKMPPP